MATVTASVYSSHVPAIGVAIDQGRTGEPYWQPLFAGYEPTRRLDARAHARRGVPRLQRPRQRLQLGHHPDVRHRHGGPVPRRRRGMGTPAGPGRRRPPRARRAHRPERHPRRLRPDAREPARRRPRPDRPALADVRPARRVAVPGDPVRRERRPVPGPVRPALPRPRPLDPPRHRVVRRAARRPDLGHRRHEPPAARAPRRPDQPRLRHGLPRRPDRRPRRAGRQAAHRLRARSRVGGHRAGDVAGRPRRHGRLRSRRRRVAHRSCATASTTCPPATPPSVTSSSRTSPAARPAPAAPPATPDDHRLPRSLHDRPTAARRVPGRPAGGPPARSGTRRGEGHDRHLRRRARRQPGDEPAAAAARARHRPHPVLATGVVDGAPRRQRAHQPVLDRALQRADPPDLRPVPRQLRACLPTAAVARCGRRVVRCASSVGASRRWASSGAT